MTTGVPWGWWEYSCWWWWQWIIHCGFDVRRVFFYHFVSFSCFSEHFQLSIQCERGESQFGEEVFMSANICKYFSRGTKDKLLKNTNKKSKGVQCITFMYYSVLKGRFVFLYSCSLYSHPDYSYLHLADCGRLIIEKSIKNTVKTTTIITIHMTR